MSLNQPNLFIVGAPRCGTTAWVEYLSQHPEIFFASPKEPHFFNTDMPNFRWYKTQKDYDALFGDTGGAQIVGEASVQYLFSTEAAKNIHAFNPKAKILVFLRHQSTFLPSYHNQTLYNRDEVESDFLQLWNNEKSGTSREIPSSCREPKLLNYSDVGKFEQQLQRYLDVFPLDQIKVLTFEEWTKSPKKTYASILDFLGLEPKGDINFTPVHQASQHRFGWLASLTQRPPNWALTCVKFLRRLLRLKSFRPSQLLRKVNKTTGYSDKISPALRDDITAYYLKNNAALYDKTGVKLLPDEASNDP